MQAFFDGRKTAAGTEIRPRFWEEYKRKEKGCVQLTQLQYSRCRSNPKQGNVKFVKKYVNAAAREQEVMQKNACESGVDVL